MARLSRNFGHQIALTAGVDLAAGDAVIVLDADLQDPPEVVLQLVARWREGYDVVYAVRQTRDGETRFKRTTAAWFYRGLNRISEVDVPLDAGDFRLIDRRALDVFNEMRESGRFVRGMFSWIGFDQTGVEYRRAERFAGDSKYPLRKMLRFAATGVTSFSEAPLRLALNLGFVVSFVSFVVGAFAVVVKVGGLFTVPGWASIVVVVTLIGGVQLIVLGVIGVYIGDIHTEVKRRPLYIISDLENFDSAPDVPLRGIIAGRRPRLSRKVSNSCRRPARFRPHGKGFGGRGDRPGSRRRFGFRAAGRRVGGQNLGRVLVARSGSGGVTRNCRHLPDLAAGDCG